jgi:hypothetical protein
MNTKIETFTGKLFDYLDPRAADMDALSIAHALGNLCRFTGHCRRFYSVAEHSVLCMTLADRRGLTRRLQLLALIHDAHEAYVGDINTPLKLALNGNFADIDAEATLLTCAALGVTPPTFSEKFVVKEIDLIALATEAQALMPSEGRDWHLSVQPEPITLFLLPPEESGYQWLINFQRLIGSNGSRPSLGRNDASTTEPTANGGRRTDSETTTPTE